MAPSWDYYYTDRKDFCKNIFCFLYGITRSKQFCLYKPDKNEYKNKKFRLNRLGFSNEVLQEFDKSLNREKNLGEIRNKQKLKNIELGR